ncbi:Na+/H+ antiporter subunit E [Salisaeta longa]|uniref:Na+/H+ antiporter subunit E n=1 Tax=Salisaeta longa TaxID=503170 RepID=UPI0003B73E8A|nr:Na+/H+ antiporter subunit E [Salisaeta longa]
MIFTLVRILIFTLIWAALQGSFSVGNVLVGVLVSGAVLAVVRPLYADDAASGAAPRPIRRLWKFVVLVLVFLRELALSATRVAQIVLKPTLDIQPGIVAYPLDVATDREITALANLITLTPGTMSLHVSEDRSTLYVHAITVASEDGHDVIEDIKGSLEKHVQRALGPRSATEVA